MFLLPGVQSEDGSGDLRIKNVQIWHEGRYACTTQSVVDSDSAYADLKIVGTSQHALSKRIIDANHIFTSSVSNVGFTLKVCVL